MEIGAPKTHLKCSWMLSRSERGERRESPLRKGLLWQCRRDQDKIDGGRTFLPSTWNSELRPIEQNCPFLLTRMRRGGRRPSLSHSRSCVLLSNIKLLTVRVWSWWRRTNRWCRWSFRWPRCSWTGRSTARAGNRAGFGRRGRSYRGHRQTAEKNNYVQFRSILILV